jgi:serine/threonine-protein kinase HipA
LADVLDILLHGRRVAQVVGLSDESSVFSLNEDFIADQNRPILSLGLKLPAGGVGLRPDVRKARIDPFLSNLLPEGTLRTAVAAANGIDRDNDFHLLKAVGEDLPGAVVVRPEGQNKRNGSAGPLAFSLSGLHMKLPADRAADGSLSVAADGGGAWVLKFPDAMVRAVCENEYWMTTLAKAVGFDVPDIDLVEPSAVTGLPPGMGKGRALAIRRDDRGSDGTRVHGEDFAQIRRVHPAGKYRNGTFEWIAYVIGTEIGAAGVVEFVRRLVFNVAIGNGDMHLKNWRLVYPDGRTPKLAPVNDFISTLTHVKREDLGLTLMGAKWFEDLSLGHFTQLADTARVPGRPVLNAVGETAERVRDAWSTLRHETDLPAHIVTAMDDHMARLPLLNP